MCVLLPQEWMETEWQRKYASTIAVPPRLFTVGRLDVASTGLIFVTNDGEMHARIPTGTGQRISMVKVHMDGAARIRHCWPLQHSENAAENGK
jgi:16S rRNA U516 pseudouridylate synthase RsuA-like enzyme